MKGKKAIKYFLLTALTVIMLLFVCFGASATTPEEETGGVYMNELIGSLISGLGLTSVLILSSTVFGFIFGAALFVLYYVSGQGFRKFLRKFSDIYSLIPITTWIVICYYFIFGRMGTGHLAAIFGLSFCFGIMVFSVLIACFDEVSPGQIEAAVTMGYDKMLLFKRIIVPQVAPRFFAGIEASLIYNIQNTSVVGFIKLNDFQAVADRMSSGEDSSLLPLFLSALVYIVFSAVVIRAVKLIGKRFFPEEIDESKAKKRLEKRGVRL